MLLDLLQYTIFPLALCIQKLESRASWLRYSYTNTEPPVSPTYPFFPQHFFITEFSREFSPGPQHLISHRDAARLWYRTFHMILLTVSFYALLHPDSITNGPSLHFWEQRPFCGWVPCSTLWLMGSPPGPSEVSLKSRKFGDRERENKVTNERWESATHAFCKKKNI